MEASLKDHKGPVNCIAVKNSGSDEAVSASSDGSCIVWDLTTHRWVWGREEGEKRQRAREKRQRNREGRQKDRRARERERGFL